MKHSWITAVFFGLSLVAGLGQTLYLKKGDSMEASGVKRTGDSISYQSVVGGGTATLTLPISAIDHVVFKDADEVSKVADLLFQGKNDEALAELEPFMAEQETYKGIPGNLWAEGAILRAKAYVREEKYEDAQPIVDELVNATDPDIAMEAALLKARSLADKGDPQATLQAYTAIIKKSVNPDILADAWYYKGKAYSVMKDHQNAVLALLHVSAFYATSPAMPSALYLAALELDELKDETSAQYYMNMLVQQFPSAAETEKAKVELRRIQNIIKSIQSTPKSQ